MQIRPHFGEPQVAIAIVFAVLAVGLACLFVVIALQTRRDVPFDVVQERGYRIRRFWLGFLVVLLVVIVGGSLSVLPYAKHSGRVTLVGVTAGQFYWSTVPAEVRAGTHVRFDVTATDVNHGWGLYDPDGQLLGSVQAMPGYHNQLDITLKKRGEYLFGCLEYCGLGHTRMLRTFKVTQ